MRSTTDMSIRNETSIQTHMKLMRLQNLLGALNLHLRDVGADSAVLADLEAARSIVQTTISVLLSGEGDDTSHTAVVEVGARTADAESEPSHAPVRRSIWGPTPMAVHALGSLRAAANAVTLWDKERGIDCGLGSVLTEYAAAARNEVFGPSD